VKRVEQKDGEVRYYGVYERNIYALMGTRRQARHRGYGTQLMITRNLVSAGGCGYAGYYGFKTIKEARRERTYQRRYRLPNTPNAEVVVVKCKYEDVFAEGGWDTNSDALNAFRAIYRTILKEVN
jgi:hypothetical protein